jgi:hypothetical protein
MAAAVAVTKSHYKYVSDAGDTFRVRAADYIAAQVDGASASIIGAEAAAGTEPPLPGGHFMRRAIVRDLVNNVDRVIVILKPTAPMITVPTPAGAGTIDLNHGTNLNTYTYQGRFLTETRGRRA